VGGGIRTGPRGGYALLYPCDVLDAYELVSRAQGNKKSTSILILYFVRFFLFLFGSFVKFSGIALVFEPLVRNTPYESFLTDINPV
jgi:hypothetical protein